MAKWLALYARSAEPPFRHPVTSTSRSRHPVELRNVERYALDSLRFAPPRSPRLSGDALTRRNAGGDHGLVIGADHIVRHDTIDDGRSTRSIDAVTHAPAAGRVRAAAPPRVFEARRTALAGAGARAERA